MRKVNYKSDFDFIMKLYSVLYDSTGKEAERIELPWPDYDWTATFWTSSKANAYTASCIGGVCVNCYNDNGKVHIVVNEHHMGLGTLKIEFKAELPRDIYPDNYQRNVIPAPLSIELVRGVGDLPNAMDAELLLPYIKGEAFTYSDFTAEQIADLQKPATDAATEVKATEKAVQEAEALREAEEKKRASAESERKAAEEKRVSAEQSRVTTEESRKTEETKRDNAESERAKAELARESAEQNRVTAEQGRADAEQSRVTAEGERSTAEQSREVAEQSRVSAESERVKAEQSRESAESDRQQSESNRAAQELNRVAAESARGTAEQTRQTQEQGRVSAEAARVTAEQNRATEFAGFADDIEEAKYKVFDDLWLTAVGTFGSIDHTHVEDGVSKPYYLNELWLTYKEAVKIFELGKLTNTDLNNRYAVENIRTVLPTSIIYSVASGSRVFMNSKIERVNLGIFIPDTSCFEGCVRLDTIVNMYSPNNSSDAKYHNEGIYKGCVKLKSIQGISRTFAYDFSLEDSPLIDLATLDLIVQKKWVGDAAKSMTITVHPDVYAKLTGDTTNEAAASLSADELAQWQAVLTAASAKNISFATV